MREGACEKRKKKKSGTDFDAVVGRVSNCTARRLRDPEGRKSGTDSGRRRGSEAGEAYLELKDRRGADVAFVRERGGTPFGKPAKGRGATRGLPRRSPILVLLSPKHA